VLLLGFPTATHSLAFSPHSVGQKFLHQFDPGQETNTLFPVQRGRSALDYATSLPDLERRQVMTKLLYKAGADKSQRHNSTIFPRRLTIFGESLSVTQESESLGTSAPTKQGGSTKKAVSGVTGRTKSKVGEAGWKGNPEGVKTRFESSCIFCNSPLLSPMLTLTCPCDV